MGEIVQPEHFAHLLMDAFASTAARLRLDKTDAGCQATQFAHLLVARHVLDFDPREFDTYPLREYLLLIHHGETAAAPEPTPGQVASPAYRTDHIADTIFLLEGLVEAPDPVGGRVLLARGEVEDFLPRFARDLMELYANSRDPFHGPQRRTIAQSLSRYEFLVRESLAFYRKNF